VKTLLLWWAELFAVAFVLPAGVVLLSARLSQTDAWVKASGLVLQMLGYVVLLVILGQTVKACGRETFWDQCLKTFQAVRSLFKHQEVICAMPSVSAGRALGAARVEAVPPPPEDIEGRLAYLEQSLERTKNRLSQFETETGENFSRVRNSLEHIDGQNQTEHTKSTTMISNLLAGSAKWQGYAISWFIIGSVCTTFSLELFRFCK